MTDLFDGKKIKGKHKSSLQLKTWKDRHDFWELLCNSNFFHMVIDCRLTALEKELMILKIFEGIKKSEY